jgi:hypothetical protein
MCLYAYLRWNSCFQLLSSRWAEITTAAAEQTEGSQAKTLKLCTKCNEARPLASFDNPQNKSGKSRFCSECRNSGISKRKKVLARVRSRPALSKGAETTLTKKALSCPSGHGKMILRDGKYRKFYEGLTPELNMPLPPRFQRVELR